MRYLFIGKSGAILLSFPDTTQDADLFVEKSPDNGRAIVTALRELGFALDEEQAAQIGAGKDFVQLKNGPFDLDLVFAPDGIERFADPLHLNEEDVMTTATPLAAGDLLLRRDLRGDDALIAAYTALTAGDGTVANVWWLSPELSAADTAYYQRLIGQAAAVAAAAGAEGSSGSEAACAKTSPAH